ncbi:MAG: DUF4239 domain-containing protein [Proteobacteria bacterium]|nr:DUF4239 domain-containing protein [Pseudomonadota bacterium]
MTLALASMPLWQSFVLVVVIGTVLGMLGPALLRRWLGLDRLRSNNEVAGFKFAVVGVVYAVNLAFATVVTWEKFRDAEAAVLQEAGAVTGLERLAGGLEPAGAEAVRKQLRDYAQAVIAQDWPAMGRGSYSPAVTQRLDALYDTIVGHDAHPQEASVLSAAYGELDSMTKARRARIALADGIVPGVIWWILAGGAVITVLFTFFFGSANLLAQVTMNGLLSFLVFVSLWAIVEINFPFAGPVHVAPLPMEVFLRDH